MLRSNAELSEVAWILLTQPETQQHDNFTLSGSNTIWPKSKHKQAQTVLLLYMIYFQYLSVINNQHFFSFFDFFWFSKKDVFRDFLTFCVENWPRLLLEVWCLGQETPCKHQGRGGGGWDQIFLLFFPFYIHFSQAQKNITLRKLTLWLKNEMVITL